MIIKIQLQSLISEHTRLNNPCYSGTIELKEMSEIIETLYEMEGVSKVQNNDNSGYYCLLVSSLHLCYNVQIWVITIQMNAGEKAALIFGDLDVDGDGTVDEEEFIK